MKSIKTHLLNILNVALLASTALVSPVQAAVLTVNGATIQQIMSDSPDTAYGGCLAIVDKTIGTTCPGNTISFDCAGKYNTVAVGNRHYSTALLAFSLSKTINFIVDDTKKYVNGTNTYCVVTRLNVVK